MKTIVISILSCLIGTLNAIGQTTDSVWLGDNKKYMYYQVVEMEGIGADTLYGRALHFLKSAYPSNRLNLDKEDKNTQSLSGKGSFLVIKKSLVTSQDDGMVYYTVHIEVKNNKYRFWLTDFVVTPFQKDRYANFVPVKGVKIPLEQGLRKFGQKKQNDYLEKVLTNSRQIKNTLNNYMLNKHATSVGLRTLQ